ncbi:MAG: DUF1207 domain-containing protein [Ignavibacteriae bacterium]|nr:DUF1207 domain-containing protein [Ignavibacteriota bacterium]
MKLNLFVFFFLIFPAVSFAQEDTEKNHWVLFPSGLNFVPFKANIAEPRIGVFKFTDAEEMKVDIGNSVDVFGYVIPSSNINLRVSADFFAYAFVTGAQGLRLQIDAVDGFFGGNISLSQTSDSNYWQSRLRILHHSAHLVDGHYSTATHSWLDNREPIPYTQDFGELTIARIQTSNFLKFRYYGGISYATLVRPNEIARLSYFTGVESYSEKSLGEILNQPTNLFLAYQLSLTGEPTYHASHNVQAGIKFGTWYEKGVTMYLGYYTGTHMFAEYYNQRLTTLGVGFTIDFY